MSTPTTVKLQIAVPSRNEDNEVTEKLYTLTLSLLVEGGEDGEIQAMPLLKTSSMGSGDGDSDILPNSGVMPIEDPPKPAPVTN